MIEVQIDARVADQFAPIVLIQSGQRCVNRGLGEDRTLLAVVQLTAIKGDPGVTFNTALLTVVQVRAEDINAVSGTDDTALAVVKVAAVQAGRTIRQQFAGLIIQ